jgi:hypothetical protein
LEVAVQARAAWAALAMGVIASNSVLALIWTIVLFDSMFRIVWICRSGSLLEMFWMAAFLIYF